MGFLAAVVVLQALPIGAEEPVHRTLRGFQPTGKYVVYVDGAQCEPAKIYATRGSILILNCAEGMPILVQPRRRSVSGIDPAKVVERKNGTVDVLASAKITPLGGYRVSGTDVLINVPRLKARLKPKPPLTGLAKVDKLVEHTPEYQRDANRYRPDPRTMARLAANQGGKVEVRVFFGSWCPMCTRFLGRLVKVEDGLADTQRYDFSYYGLPNPPAAWRDPEFRNRGVKKLPTAIVYRGGRAAGTITGRDWHRPELRLQSILGG